MNIETVTDLAVPQYPVVVPGVGPTRARGMIIGEAPGRNEVIQGIPFCGQSGEVLDEALECAGTTRDEFFITNVFKGDVGVGNKNPKSAQPADHRGLLDQEVEDDVDLIGILLLGRFATRAFIPACPRLGELVGDKSDFEGIALFPCWHPAYTIRRPKLRPDFRRVVATFVAETE